MPIKIKWTITCDGCGMVVEEERSPAEPCDEWELYIPDGWIEFRDDDTSDHCYLLFHHNECCKNWLRSHNRTKELQEFEDSVWIA